MTEKKTAPRERLVKRVEFVLGKNQTLFVDAGSMIGPGLCQVLVKNKNGRVEVSADGGGGGGARFRFRKGKRRPHDVDFLIANLNQAEAIEDILHGKFWGQFNWGELFLYQDRKFQRKVDRRIKQLVAEFDEHAAKELNAIPRPSRKK